MEQVTEAGTTANSGRETVRTKRRLRPVVIRRAQAATAEAGGQSTARSEATAGQVEALISVWWDSLPGAESPGQ